MKSIVLSNGMEAYVDDSDFECFGGMKWAATKRGRNWYAHRRENGPGEGRYVYLHRLISQAGPGEIVDHINRDSLDNRKSNLRIVSASQSVANTRHRSRVSKYRGVTQAHYSTNWCSRISVKRKTIHLGTFSSQEEAARTYDTAARELYGQFAVTNF